jgi:hypothetical protein
LTRLYGNGFICHNSSIWQRFYLPYFIQMDNIHEPTRNFPFSQLSIISPTSIPGGAHFSKLLMNKLPLYIQTPKCKTKQGVVKSGKKLYSDLVFTHEDEEFIQWLETLETTVRKMIYENRTKWFDGDLTEEDIENYFTPTIKLYKSGKMYLVRVNANSKTSGSITVSNMKIYDENETAVEMDSIDDKTSMITIVEVQGVKCSSKSFQIEIELKQIMVLKPVDLFQKCIIKTNGPLVPVSNPIPDPVDDLGTDFKEPLEKNEEKPVISIEIKEHVDEPIEEPIEESDPIIKILGDDVSEVDFDLDNLEEADTFHLKEKTEVYYEMYRNARRKAKLAKSLALSSFMEARRIKNLYMLDDIDDSDSDLDDLDESDE